MSEGDWSNRDKAVVSLFALFAFGVLFAAIYVSAYVSGEQQGRELAAATRPEATGKRQIGGVCGTPTDPGFVDCVYDTIAATQAARLSEQDLRAQQGMHWWTVWMVLVGVSQTFVAGAALWFLRADLRQNRMSGETQLRAYVALKPIEGTATQIGRAIEIYLHAINYGQTPARNTEFQYACAFNPADWVWPEDVRGDRNNNASITIHPGVPSQLRIEGDGALSREQWGQIASGEMAIFARGIMHYDDVFGKAHTTQITFEIRRDELGTQGLRISPHGSYAT